MLTELNELLDRLKQRPSQSPQTLEKSDTSCDETDTSRGRRTVRSKKNFRKKVYAATKLGRIVATGPTNAASKPNHFYCRMCRKYVKVLTHGHHEVLRQFQGARHFARDQRLSLEIPGWRVLHFHEDRWAMMSWSDRTAKYRRVPCSARLWASLCWRPDLGWD